MGYKVAKGSHVQKHEETNGSPDGDKLIRDVEGDEGEGDKEEGGDQGSDEDALQSPTKVKLKPQVGVAGGVLLASLVLVELGENFIKTVKYRDLIPGEHRDDSLAT